MRAHAIWLIPVSLGLLAATTSLSSAGAVAPTPVWTAQPSANPSGGASAAPHLEAVSTSSGAGWAVGEWETSTRRHSLIEHLTSSGWTYQPVGLLTGNNELHAVATISKGNAWAVGDHFTNQGGAVLVLHYDGTKWAHVPAPHETIHATGATAGPAYSLAGIAALSSRNIWAVGDASCQSYLCPNNAFTEHYDGKRWSEVKTPTSNRDTALAGVAGLNATHVWAVGSDTNNATAVILGYSGNGWHVIKIPEPGSDVELNAVTAPDSDAIWAVGSDDSSGGSRRTLILHRVGGAWQHVSSPNRGDDSFLESVAAVSDKNVWAVGASFAHDTSRTLIEHWNGKQWSIVASPNPTGLGAIVEGVTTRSNGTSFAVGSTDVGDSGATTYAATTAG